MATKTKLDDQTDPTDDDPEDALEQALMAIHGIADVLSAVGQCRDIVMPTNGLSYLGGELLRAYEEAQEAFERIGYAKREPRSAVWPENMRSPNARDDARLLRAAADKLEAEAGDNNDGGSSAA